MAAKTASEPLTGQRSEGCRVTSTKGVSPCREDPERPDREVEHRAVAVHGDPLAADPAERLVDRPDAVGAERHRVEDLARPHLDPDRPVVAHRHRARPPEGPVTSTRVPGPMRPRASLERRHHTAASAQPAPRRSADVGGRRPPPARPPGREPPRPPGRPAPRGRRWPVPPSPTAPPEVRRSRRRAPPRPPAGAWVPVAPRPRATTPPGPGAPARRPGGGRPRGPGDRRLPRRPRRWPTARPAPRRAGTNWRRVRGRPVPPRWCAG